MATIYGSSIDRASGESVIHAIDDNPGLSGTISTFRRKDNLILERSIISLSAGKLGLVIVQFELAQFVQNGLVATTDRINDIASVLRRLIPIRAILRENRCPEAFRSQLIFAAAVGKRGLEGVHPLTIGGLRGEATLQLRDLVHVHQLSERILRAVDSHLHITAAAAKLSRKRGKSTLDTIEASHSSSLIETSLHAAAIAAAVAVDDNGSRTIAATTTVIVAAPVTAERCDNDNHKDHPPAAITEAAVAAALTAHIDGIGCGLSIGSGAYQHRRRNPAATFIIKCHIYCSFQNIYSRRRLCALDNGTNILKTPGFD